MDNLTGLNSIKSKRSSLVYEINEVFKMNKKKNINLFSPSSSYVTRFKRVLAGYVKYRLVFVAHFLDTLINQIM